jgi:hypothetical protein
MMAFDLFRATSHGTEWVSTFLDLDVAKSDATNRAAEAPGQYFVVDQISGDKLFELLATDGGTGSATHEKHL